MNEFELCDRVGKWYRPCNWTTVFDYKGPSESLRQHVANTWEIPLAFAELLVENETYVGTTCLTCGKFIDKDGTNGTE
jgi:hypothetical protein